MVNRNFWKDKKIFITGHTGFKGSYLSLWLYKMGANITGYALAPITNPSLYKLLNIQNKTNSIIGDINDFPNFKTAIHKAQPEIIFHLAAQPLVRESYINPVLTYQTNVMGTAHLLEIVRTIPSVRIVINITTDKCYENKEIPNYSYKEEDAMGGYDPYSSSKACSELVTAAYRQSFFNPVDYGSKHQVSLATARAGNVIGGGDFSQDRLLPDVFKAIIKNQEVYIRNPTAVRPWQYVLEPLSGYLMLAEEMWLEPKKFCKAYNFGPNKEDIISVKEIVNKIGYDKIKLDTTPQPHEAKYLQLDITKAKRELSWQPKLSIDNALKFTTEWYLVYKNGQDTEEFTLKQLNNWSNL